MLAPVLVCLLLFSLCVQLFDSECSHIFVSVPRIKKHHSTAKVIEVIVHTNLFFVKKSNGAYKINPILHIELDGPLVIGKDYEINYMIAENSLPYYHNSRRQYHNASSVVSLSLLPEKQWISNNNNRTNKNFDLHITRAFRCSNSDEIITFNASAPSSKPSKIHIATILTQSPRCPNISHVIADSPPSFSSYLNNALMDCSNIRIIKLSRLNQLHMPSLSFLSPNMQFLFVDANDHNNISHSAREVDKFLGPHSVLDVVWEPYSDDESRWFILMPHPRGMPGHLLAMIDHVQWHHPLVMQMKNKSSVQPQCSSANADTSNCDLGCPGTFLHRLTASGYGADSWHLMLDTRRALLWNEPVQVAPMRLGKPKMGGPDWQGQLGWTYTYGGCPTNFLDCYFLSHTPCPMLTVDPRDILRQNKTRMKNFHLPKIDQIDKEAFRKSYEWWESVMGSERSTSRALIPPQSFGEHHHKPAEQTFYAYMWRPQYELRKEIHLRVKKFNLSENCAAMHVRRGDIVTHGKQSRAYIRVESYVRAARPLMDAMQIKTILLFTDSQSAIDEAHNCTRDYPDVCEGIKFRYVEKKRWYGAEGGWENPFPSGSPQQELYSIQQEFALAQKCHMMVMGQSNYGEKLYMHMCCGFPLRQRGRLPQRCICPPRIQLSQSGFGSCEAGNLLLCKNNKIDERTFTQESIAKEPQEIYLDNYFRRSKYYPSLPEKAMKEIITSFVQTSVWFACRSYDHGPPKPQFCK